MAKKDRNNVLCLQKRPWRKRQNYVMFLEKAAAKKTKLNILCFQKSLMMIPIGLYCFQRLKIFTQTFIREYFRLQDRIKGLNLSNRQYLAETFYLILPRFKMKKCQLKIGKREKGCMLWRFNEQSSSTHFAKVSICPQAIFGKYLLFRTAKI